MVLPKSMRLQGHRCFDHLYRQGIRYHESSMVLRVVNSEPGLHKSKIREVESTACRCAIAISSKVSKKAVVRNRMRRLIHEHLRAKLSKASAHANKWIFFSLKPQSSNKGTAELLKECDRLLMKAGLLV